MDRITHQVRLANWTKIIEECNNRPAVTFAEIPLPEQQTSITDTFKADTFKADTFKADAVIHTGTMVIGISNTISDTLLSHLLEVAHHAR